MKKPSIREREIEGKLREKYKNGGAAYDVQEVTRRRGGGRRRGRERERDSTAYVQAQETHTLQYRRFVCHGAATMPWQPLEESKYLRHVLGGGRRAAIDQGGAEGGLLSGLLGRGC